MLLERSWMPDSRISRPYTSAANDVAMAAPVGSMPLLEAIIKNMDSTAPRAAEIRTFKLVNADAQQMGSVLTQLFGLTGTGAAAAPSATARAARYTLVTSQPAEGEPPVTATLGTSETYALRVTVDVRTNSLLIGGTKQYVDLCAKVIEELDSSPLQERQTAVYRLRNARASEIQTALQNWMTAERQKITQNLGTTGVGSAQRLLETEVAVVAVPNEGKPENTNTLLLSASPRYFKTITDIIKELDQPPPQVLVQVLLAEVTLDDELDLGMDWTYTETHDGKTYKAGTNFGVSADFARGGGFSASITGSHVNFFLRALQSSGRLEVLSRPQVLAQDNQVAHIQIGQSVPYVTYSQLNENGSLRNTIAYRDVGVILDVTPRISPDGLVKLLVKPEVSDIGNSTVPISEGLNAAVFNTRTASTTITVQDGHTIILGGLITSSDNDTVRKIPLMGDIPLLGNLFRSTTKTKQRRELLIILTPHIVNNVAAGDALTAEQKKTLKLMDHRERDVTKDTLFTPLETLPEGGKTPATQPDSVTKELLIPELRDAPPGRKPAATTMPATLIRDKEYE